jgi:hypothetical protein
VISISAYPIRLVAIIPLVYFAAKPQISIVGMMLGNPMILGMVLIGVLMIMFPNTFKEMQKAQEEMKKQGGGKTQYSTYERECERAIPLTRITHKSLIYTQTMKVKRQWRRFRR